MDKGQPFPIMSAPSFLKPCECIALIIFLERTRTSIAFSFIINVGLGNCVIAISYKGRKEV
jgi:hypothetical protein